MVFGPWIGEVLARRRQFTRAMEWGLVVSLVTGLALAAPWPAGYEPNYTKITVKLVILVVLGAVLGIGRARQRRSGQPVEPPLFWAAGLLSAAAAGIAVIA